MQNVEEAILNSDAIELIVTDSWQIPADYKVYKKGYNMNLNPKSDFVCIYSEEEYKEFIERIKEVHIENWEMDYTSDEESKDKLTWKLIVYYGDGKKIIKRGENEYPETFDLLEEYMIEVTNPIEEA